MRRERWGLFVLGQRDMRLCRKRRRRVEFRNGVRGGIVGVHTADVRGWGTAGVRPDSSDRDDEGTLSAVIRRPGWSSVSECHLYAGFQGMSRMRLTGHGTL
jgi:hypothetical protein